MVRQGSEQDYNVYSHVTKNSQKVAMLIISVKEHDGNLQLP